MQADETKLKARRVYLDNAASTPMAAGVLAAMMPYLETHFGNPSSVHYYGRTLRTAVENARKKVADILGCSPAEIVFTGGGTEADNYAIKGTVESKGIKNLITSPLEHHAVTHTAEAVEKSHGVKIHWLTPDKNGNLSLVELENHLSTLPNVMVSLMHGNNEIATLNNIEGIGELCKKYGAVFHSDTVQTMGHLPINVSKLNVDFVVGSAHKFYGPKGIGFLYNRNSMPLPNLICGGGQERNQRAGTENVAGIVGLAAALEMVTQNPQEHINHLQGLKTYFISELTNRFQGVQFNGEIDAEKALPTVLNVAFPVQDEESMLLMNLDINGVAASGGSACTSGSVSASHVLQALKLPPARMANSVRFSFGNQTVKEDIDYTLQVLEKVLGKKPVLA